MATTPEISFSGTLPVEAAAEAAAPAVTNAGTQRTANWVFRGALSYAIVTTLLWLFFVITQIDGGPIIGRYNVDRQSILNVFFGFLFMTVIWGWIWFRIRRVLLRRVAGFSKEELAEVFTSRMQKPLDLRGRLARWLRRAAGITAEKVDGVEEGFLRRAGRLAAHVLAGRTLARPFDLQGYLARHRERTIRVIDMVGRRGRFITIGFGGFLYMHNRIIENPSAQMLTLGFQDNLFDAVAFCWLNLLAYYSDGFLGRVAFGAQSRLMDGSLARANCLLIGTLWNAFKFIMVPLSIQLGAHFPPASYAALFGFIWLSYQISDTMSEIVGSLFGKQKLRVWGMGEVNRKSVAGTWACFLTSLALCSWLIWIHHLPTPWIGLAVVVSLSNTFFELFSPRGTDDFTMATANALLCWAFGVFVL